GRWNPPGVPAVYTSLNEETAVAEMRQRHRRGGVPMSKSMPRVLVAIRVRLARVLDLTQKKVRRILGGSLARLCEEWQDRLDGEDEAITQAIGRLAWERGLDGLLVPSVPGRPRGVNLIIYPDRAPAGWGEIYNQEELSPKEPEAP